MANNFTVESKHVGQYKPYGDYFRVWDIKTDATKEDVIERCFSEVYKCRIPETSEFHRNIRYGTGEKSGDASYYFSGYYTIEPIDGGFRFTVCEPFAD